LHGWIVKAETANLRVSIVWPRGEGCLGLLLFRIVFLCTVEGFLRDSQCEFEGLSFRMEGLGCWSTV
jgi:hypothetical protein